MDATDERVERISERAIARGWRVVTAESLTSGKIAARLGSGPNGAEWFGGGVVAYQEDIKFGLLQVDRGPVVSARCAEQLARGAQRIFDAQVAVSATGEAGPQPSEDKPPGTVFISVATPDGTVTRELDLDGEPEEILEKTVAEAVAFLDESMSEEQQD